MKKIILPLQLVGFLERPLPYQAEVGTLYQHVESGEENHTREARKENVDPTFILREYPRIP